MFLLLQKSIPLKPEQTSSVSIDLLYETLKEKDGPNPETHQVKFALEIHFWLQIVTQDEDPRPERQKVQ